MEVQVFEVQLIEEPLPEGADGQIEGCDASQRFSPASAISYDTMGNKRRRKGKRQEASDLILLRATDALKPYQAPRRTMIEIWEKVAERVNSESNLNRQAKYCRERVGSLLKEYRVKKNVKDPTGDGQQPEQTEEDQLLQSIDASEEEGCHMSEIQKEKATEDQLLIDTLEQDTLKSFADKSCRADAQNLDDEWEDDHDRDKAQAEREAMSLTVPTTPSKKRPNGQAKWSPWKRTPGAARRAREDLFREKFRNEAESRKEELKDKKDEREFQREKFKAEQTEKQEEREMQKDKIRTKQAEKEEERKLKRETGERADNLRRDEIAVQRQNGELLQMLVLSLVKKD